jgi:hypothetical protein
VGERVLGKLEVWSLIRMDEKIVIGGYVRTISWRMKSGKAETSFGWYGRIEYGF